MSIRFLSVTSFQHKPRLLHVALFQTISGCVNKCIVHVLHLFKITEEIGIVNRDVRSAKDWNHTNAIMANVSATESY